MIRNINNIDISSAILKSQRDGDTGNLSNSVHIGVSYESGLSKTDLQNYSLRLFICTTGNSLKLWITCSSGTMSF
jgi:hypothetical protein